MPPYKLVISEGGRSITSIPAEGARLKKEGAFTGQVVSALRAMDKNKDKSFEAHLETDVIGQDPKTVSNSITFAPYDSQ